VAHAAALPPIIPPGMTMPDMAMRFILSHPDVSTIIPGMRKIKHVDTNIATSDAGALDQNLITELQKHRWERTPTSWSQ
jgi:aryl-alcohol dehydrogenase-like predicted oxidoreductase